MSAEKLLSAIGWEIKLNNTKIEYAFNMDDLGGEPNKIEVTAFKDKAQVMINGVQEQDAFGFDYRFNATDWNAVEAAITACATAPVPIEVKNPLGDTWTNTCDVSQYHSGMGVNDPANAHVTCALQSEWTVTIAARQ